MRDIDYDLFVRNAITTSEHPVLPVSLQRGAAMAGANLEGERLRYKLRWACEALANGPDFKRVRVKGVSGYHYTVK